MVLACHQFNAVDAQGNIAPGASVEVTLESSGSLATIYSDRNGSSPLANPFQADANGFARFFALGGAYRITATKNGSSQTWRYVGIGTANEADAGALATGLSFLGEWATGTLYTASQSIVSSRGSSYVCSVSHTSDPSTEPGTGASWATVWTLLVERGGDEPRWRFDTSTVMGDPGSGDLRFNAASFASTTSIAISSLSSDVTNPSFNGWETSWDDGSSTVRGYLTLRRVSAPEQYVIFAVTGLSTGGLWNQITVSHISSNGALFSNAEPLSVSFSRNGDVGNPYGLTWTFNSTTAIADPGLGTFRLNHASPASATVLIMDDTTDAPGNPDASAYVATWGNSTSVVKGHVLIINANAPQNFAVYELTGVANNTGYKELSLAHVSSNGAFSGSCVIAFYQTGDKGDIGGGGGGGSSTPPSTPPGRLTPTSGVPVISANVLNAGTIFYTMIKGQYGPLYDGSTFVSTNLGSELSNVLANSSSGKAGPLAAAANSVYDLYYWDDAGTIRLTRSPAWANDTNRGTGPGTAELELFQGVLVNKQAITNGPAARRGVYVGTIETNASALVDMNLFDANAATAAARLGIWNMYNRVNTRARLIHGGGGTHTYSTAANRAYGGLTTTRFIFVSGQAEDALEVAIGAGISNTATGDHFIGVGLDSTTVLQTTFIRGLTNSKLVGAVLSNGFAPQLGKHFISVNEIANVAGQAATLYQSLFTLTVFFDC